MLSEIQSSLALKTRPFQRPLLKFISAPQKPTDPPAELDLNDSRTARFVTYRTKDLPAFYDKVVMLLPIGNYEADRHREALLEAIEKHMRTAVQDELGAWQREKAKCHIDQGISSPEIISTGVSNTRKLEGVFITSSLI